MTTVAEFVIAADAQRWHDVGFAVTPQATLQLGGVVLRFVGGSGGMLSWVLADAADRELTDIDGLATAHGEPPAEPGREHPNTVTSIDHLVVYTPNLERTTAAIAAGTGAPLKRVREVGELRQGFHRLGEVIVEVVSFPQVAGDTASFWGLAVNARDIDALYERVGDALMSAPKDAVQPGRRIASFREAAGLGLAVAVMTPHVTRA